MYGLDEKSEPVRDHEPGNGNFWRTIGSVIKYFRLGWNEIIWGRSWANVLMLISSIPDSTTGDDGGQEITSAKELEGIFGL